MAKAPTDSPAVADDGRLPFVSVVIPVRNEEHHLPACTRSLRELDYPADRYEVIFADGRSTDRSVALAEQAGFRVVDNPGLRVATGREAGFAVAHGDIIAFTDADCRFEHDWLRKAARHFDDAAVAGVSGPTRVPPEQNAFGRAVGIVFGMAGAMGTTVHLDAVVSRREVNDLPGCNCFYRRDALAAVMPMNTGLATNEDVEMNAHIRRKGYRLWMAPDVVLHHFKRTSPMGFWRQMYRFARDRATLSRRDRGVLGAGHLVVGIGVPVAVAVVLLAAWLVDVRILGIAAACAVGVAVAVLAVAGRRFGMATAASLLLALGGIGIVWPVGFLRGMLASSRRLARPTPVGERGEG